MADSRDGFWCFVARVPTDNCGNGFCPCHRKTLRHYGAKVLYGPMALKPARLANFGQFCSDSTWAVCDALTIKSRIPSRSDLGAETYGNIHFAWHQIILFLLISRFIGSKIYNTAYGTCALFWGHLMRIVQKEAKKGSQRWLQWAVNQNPRVLNDLIFPKLRGATKITWLSPLTDDSLAEYRDRQFLKRIGAELLASKLAKYWPRRGPQWDGLAVTDAGDVLLIEGNAHIGELCSPATQASPSSRKLIQKSLRKCASYVRAEPCAPWSGAFYQLANRLAHLYFLRKNGVKV